MTKRELPQRPILIPSDATQVFKGKLFDVYQWNQELFDGSFATFEMLRRPDTVITLALDDKGMVIASDEEQPGGIVRTDHLPAGRIDNTDPTTLAAAQRELKEETGYEMQQWALVDVIQPESKIEWFVYFYVARGVSSMSTPSLDAGEKIQVKLIDYSRARNANTASSKFSVLAPYASLNDIYKKVNW
ncbi:MAG: NUDIX hydrolase [Candidatus Saccharimonadales bacterium]